MSAFTVTPAVSELIRMKDSTDLGTGEGQDPTATAKSRENWKKEKELEEARKVAKLTIK